MAKSISELQEKILKFREDREWKQFHTIKDLLIGLDIEVSELAELFLWKNNEEIDLVEKEKIEDEVADIFIFLSYICDEFDVDLTSAIQKKIDKNSIKYPLEKSRGSNKKYDKL